ncbi:Spherulation-specific family 4-domain-containing protein [Lasiosphaeria ovina]|uniref:Spherulation-specific family 4-domain-containing protein n=1 Tax=Lasiosphaeria ovina TaxID=92902 RepID=A0AAE0NA42_9PEZI|nr:Spherulation-specific family 4-domain-containing protein [Lasiosphaeria ovina]
MKWLLTAALAASSAAATDLIVPLYQYPLDNGAVWQPIYDALTSNQNLIAKIIINPDSGPGGPANGINDGWYKTGAQNLASHANAQLFGYVHTSTDGGQTRCSAPYETVVANITRWSDWVAAGVAIQGIFIDEAPASTANDCVAYMRNLTEFIRTDASLRFPGRLVIFNPGGTGDLQPFYDLKPTLILALETCFIAASADPNYDGCSGSYERYDHAGFGSSIDAVLLPSIGAANAPATAVVVHGFHGSNGDPANLVADADTLAGVIRAAVARKIGAVFFNTAWYQQFSDAPATIGAVASLLSAANAAA